MTREQRRHVIHLAVLLLLVWGLVGFTGFSVFKNYSAFGYGGVGGSPVYNAPITFPQNSPACADNIDNDGDVKIDYPTDTGCISPFDVREDDENTFIPPSTTVPNPPSPGGGTPSEGGPITQQPPQGAGILPPELIKIAVPPGEKLPTTEEILEKIKQPPVFSVTVDKVNVSNQVLLKAFRIVKTLPNRTVHIIMNPQGEGKVVSIKGYLYKKANTDQTLLPWLMKYVAYAQKSPTDVLVSSFNFTQEQGSQSYVAIVKAPNELGNYQIETVVSYASEGGLTVLSETQDLHLIVDPEGYVYAREPGKSKAVAGATISLYKLHDGINQYQLWDGGPFAQTNPQKTKGSGLYGYIVPRGQYYLQVSYPGYEFYQTKSFAASDGAILNFPVELQKRTITPPTYIFAWMKGMENFLAFLGFGPTLSVFLSGFTILIALLLVLLGITLFIFNAYRKRVIKEEREELAAEQKQQKQQEQSSHTDNNM